MGSNTIHEINYGENAGVAYDRAVADADSYYGHQQGYTGAINSTQGVREIRLPEGINYGTKKFKDYIEKLIDKMSKHDSCVAIELPKKMWRDKNVNKISGVSAEDIVTKGTRKWETVYGVFADEKEELDIYGNKFNNRSDNKKLVKELTTKTEALKYGRAYSLKYGVKVQIEVRKKLTGAPPVVARISPKFKSVKEKEKAYLIIGVASS